MGAGRPHPEAAGQVHGDAGDGKNSLGDDYLTLTSLDDIKDDIIDDDDDDGDMVIALDDF